MKKISEEIENIIQHDPGNRGLGKWARRGDLWPASRGLLAGCHIIIGTGFYIYDVGVIETDGPPGAIILAMALGQLGKKVSLAVDDHAEAIFRAGFDVVGCKADLIVLPARERVDPARLIRTGTTHFVALERPGKARDGKYYNLRGMIFLLLSHPWMKHLCLPAKTGL